MPSLKVQVTPLSGFGLTKKAPCRLDITLPLELPSQVDGSVPPPPYYPPNDLLALRPHTIPILTRILTALLAELFGPDSRITKAVRDGDADDFLTETFHGSWIRQGNYNADTGDYVDQHGVPGSGVWAQLFFSNRPEVMYIIHSFRFVIDYRVGEDSDPEVVELVANGQLHKGKVVFATRRLDGDDRAMVNGEIAKEKGARAKGKTGSSRSAGQA